MGASYITLCDKYSMFLFIWNSDEVFSSIHSMIGTIGINGPVIDAESVSY